MPQVPSSGDAGGAGGTTPESIDMHLNQLRGAVAAYGGSVEVQSVEQVGG